MSITTNPKHQPFVNYLTSSQIFLWLEEHLIYYDEFKVSISYSEWLVAPYCISITMRYFPVINDDNNIHIKSIKSIFEVWCVSAIVTAQCEGIIQQVSHTDNKPQHSEAEVCARQRYCPLAQEAIPASPLLLATTSSTPAWLLLRWGLWVWTFYDHFLGTTVDKHYTTGHNKAFHCLFLLPCETSLTEKGNYFCSYCFNLLACFLIAITDLTWVPKSLLTGNSCFPQPHT